jgi:hypothetical protein
MGRLSHVRVEPIRGEGEQWCRVDERYQPRRSYPERQRRNVPGRCVQPAAAVSGL